MSFNLTNWLRKTPQPTAVMADDKRIEVPKNHRAYRDLTQTIKAMEPSKITCLNANGDVIRSISMEAEDDKPSASASPEMNDLQLFAKLLAEGYEHGRRANQPIIDSAMQFVERQSVRLAKAESEIERLRAHNHKLNLHIAELSAQPIVEQADDSIMGAMLAGALQGAAQNKPQQVTPIKNGAKT
jgi:hypothetical protein